MDESPGKMYALASVLTVLAIVAVVLRFYARCIKKVGSSWDDYSIVLALVGFFAMILASRWLMVMFLQKISTIATGVCMFVGRRSATEEMLCNR